MCSETVFLHELDPDEIRGLLEYGRERMIEGFDRWRYAIEMCSKKPLPILRKWVIFPKDYIHDNVETNAKLRRAVPRRGFVPENLYQGKPPHDLNKRYNRIVKTLCLVKIVDLSDLGLRRLDGSAVQPVQAPEEPARKRRGLRQAKELLERVRAGEDVLSEVEEFLS